jgi:hypothetical protein
MINIKRFVDRINMQEGKNSRDVVLPIAEARGIRDELVKLLLDMQTMAKSTQTPQPPVEADTHVQIIGGKW